MFGFTKKIESLENKNVESTRQIAELTQSVELLKATKTTHENDLSALNEKIKLLEGNLTEFLEYKKKKESENPFIEVISESFDEEIGMQIKLDWNEAMINYLKRNGYRGLTDDEIIEKYVSDVFNDRAKNGPDPIT